MQVSAQTLHVALAIPEDEAERMVAEGRDAVIRLHRLDHVCLRVADLERGVGAVAAPVRARRALARRRPGAPRVQRRAVLPRARRGRRARGTTTRRSSWRRTARSTTRARTSTTHGVAWEEREGSLFLADPDGRPRAGDAVPRRRRARSTAGRSTRGPRRPSTSAEPAKLGHVNCLTGDIQAGVRLLHRRARDAASRTGSARPASGSTSTPTTT